MERSDVPELHYITAIENVPSILEKGILSHNGARSLPHASIAMSEIQALRRKIVVPGGLPLHDYVNLYMNARNPMMYKRRGDHASLTVLRLQSAVLELPGAVIASGNASSDYTRFAASPAGLEILDAALVNALDWRSEDEIDYFRRKSAICAEVLVPERVDPQYIGGAYVSCRQAEEALGKLCPGLAIELRPGLFFQG